MKKIVTIITFVLLSTVAFGQAYTREKDRLPYKTNKNSVLIYFEDIDTGYLVQKEHEYSVYLSKSVYNDTVESVILNTLVEHCESFSFAEDYDDKKKHDFLSDVIMRIHAKYSAMIGFKTKVTSANKDWWSEKEETELDKLGKALAYYDELDKPYREKREAELKAKKEAELEEGLASVSFSLKH